jgi:hypothetical protein
MRAVGPDFFNTKAGKVGRSGGQQKVQSEMNELPQRGSSSQKLRSGLWRDGLCRGPPANSVHRSRFSGGKQAFKVRLIEIR